MQSISCYKFSYSPSLINELTERIPNLKSRRQGKVPCNATMYADISKPPAPLPQSELKTVGSGVSILSPLSRRGVGPGLILLVPSVDNALAIEEGVPALPLKWAEEGYTVIAIQPTAFKIGARETLELAIQTFRKSDKCDPKDVVGLVGELQSPSRVLGMAK